MTTKGESSPPALPDNPASLPELLGQIDAIAEGASDSDSIASGFPSLDRSIGGGFRRGDLAILGGDVGSGKSAFALAIAIRSAERHSVAYFSAEMTQQRLMERVLAMEGRVRIDELLVGRPLLLELFECGLVGDTARCGAVKMDVHGPVLASR